MERGEKETFFNAFPDVLKEMLLTGDVKEETYDNLRIPIDTDSKGNRYELSSTSLIRSRCKCVYSKAALERTVEKAKKFQRAEVAKLNDKVRNGQQMLKNNKECENLFGLSSDVNINEVSIPSLKVLEHKKFKKELLGAFVACRLLKYTDKKFVIPNKGTENKVLNGEKCAVTKKELLIKQVQDVFRNPVRIKMVEANTIATPTLLIPNPCIVMFRNNLMMNDTCLTNDWCKKVYENIESVNNRGWDAFRNVILDSTLINTYVKFYANIFLDRLPSYMEKKLPKEREDLNVHRHWNFEAFTRNLLKYSAIIILSGHAPDFDSLKCCTAEDSLFQPLGAFSIANGILENLDGNYLIGDIKRWKLIRSGAAEMGFKKRFKQHEVCSKLLRNEDRSSKFYLSYPHKDCLNKNQYRKGTFQDNLRQYVGVGFSRSKAREIVSLFDWTDKDKKELSHLSAAGGRTHLQDKQYRHLCYHFELIYGLGIKYEDNISSNPGCEWQLRYYGNK